MLDFINYDYLKDGNLTQKKVYNLLKDIKIFEKLAKYKPILVGTIPIEIDIVTSDLDIVCEVYDLLEFEKVVSDNFSTYDNFLVERINKDVLVVSFRVDSFIIELYASNQETIKQNGYRHMLIEYQLLNLGGPGFKEYIISLKQKGIKTEKAFATALNLEGDPYQAILALEGLSDVKLKELLSNAKY